MAAPFHALELDSLDGLEYVLPHEGEDRIDSALSSPGECPSLIISFMSGIGEPVSKESTRRSSITSSAPEGFSDWTPLGSNHSASPVTPVAISHGPRSMERYFKGEDVFGSHELYDIASFTRAKASMWPGQEAVNVAQLNMACDMHFVDVLNFPDEVRPCQGYNTYSQGIHSNPPLSRCIFEMDEGSHGERAAKQESLLWRADFLSSLPTITPAAAFQSGELGSPLIKSDPSTPDKSRLLSLSILDSSPAILISPPIVPSQKGRDDNFSYESLEQDVPAPRCEYRQSPEPDEFWSDILTPEKRYHRPTMHRRSYQRRSKVGPSNRPKAASAKSGINCEVVITQNEFACSWPGCVDKDTGRPKRFKRQEHKKRHEKTVHLKENEFSCWVPTCKTKPFSRTDNLKSHLKNTHGRKSINQRNVYVATLDEKSQFYDPEWRGEIDEDGFPKLPQA